MPLNQKIIYSIPGIPLLLIILFVVVGLSLLGLWTVRRFFSHEILKAHNDVAGFMFATLGVVYAVLLAFVVIIVWESYERTNADVSAEANCMMMMYRGSEIFPDPEKKHLRSLLRDYANVVIEKEWKSLARGESSPETDKIMLDIWKAYLRYTPGTEAQKIIYAESISTLHQFSALRRQLVQHAMEGLPALLWLVLIVGGVITVAFTFFFGTENLHAQTVMTALLAALIGLMLFTILSMDFPFTGDFKISPETFRQLLTRWSQP
jgi:uncharacterized integral membrane protein